MVLAELKAKLKTDAFVPFRITMNNGQVIDVKHPELAIIAYNGVLYVYDPGPEEGYAAGPPKSYAIHNMCSIEPIPTRAA